MTFSDFCVYYFNTNTHYIVPHVASELSLTFQKCKRPLESVHITTNVVSSNPAHGEKFASDGGGRWFSSGTPVSCTNKTDHPDITEILL